MSSGLVKLHLVVVPHVFGEVAILGMNSVRPVHQHWRAGAYVNAPFLHVRA